MTSIESPKPRLYRIKQAAQELTISERQLARLIAAGRVKVVRFGRSVRISETDLLDLIAACRGG